MVTHEDPELTSSPRRGRDTASPKPPHSREGSHGQSPSLRSEGSVCAPHPAHQPWDRHQSDAVPKTSGSETSGTRGCCGDLRYSCWGAQTQRLILGTRAKAAVWEVTGLHTKEIQLLVLKLQLEAQGIPWGRRGAGKHLSALSPSLGAQRGMQRHGLLKAEGVGPSSPTTLSFCTTKSRCVLPTPRAPSQPWFPTGNA